MLRMGIRGSWITKSYLEMILERKGRNDKLQMWTLVFLALLSFSFLFPFSLSFSFHLFSFRFILLSLNFFWPGGYFL